MQGFNTCSRMFAGIAAACALAAPAAAQDGAGAPYQPPRATAYEEVTELPDWTGIWYPDWSALFSTRAAAARPQLTPAAQAKFDEYSEQAKQPNGPPLPAQAQCLPPGLPGVMQQPYPIEILFSPGRVTIITEAYQQVRRVYTDGRPLPDDPDPFFNGTSVGHWEGDTLVFTTVGLHPFTTIAPGIGHSDQMRIEERIWLEKPGQMIDEMTITDPEVLTEPFVTRVAFKLDNEFPIREYVCAENNRLVSDEHGANIDLDLEGDPEDPFGPPIDD